MYNFLKNKVPPFKRLCVLTPFPRNGVFCFGLLFSRFENLEIGRDGSISIRAAGQAAITQNGVDRIRLVNPPQDQLYRGGDGLFRSRDAVEFPAYSSVTVTLGAFEASNVSAVDAMLRMIDYARYYEQQLKLMQLAGESDAASALDEYVGLAHNKPAC